VIGTQATGKTEIINVKQARIKETDRIHSMTEGLRLLGARVDEHEDGLCIYKSTLKGAEIRGFGDHRTVMALSIAGLLAEGSTIIDDAESINKTYPNYIRDMKSIGAKMELQKHIVLIGFKSVGKSAVGRQLALQLGKAFIDLDKQIENVYENENNSTLSCRQIMQKHGEAYFRELEHKTLLSTVDLNPSVISVGGGTPLYEKNHLLLNDHCLVHITAPKAVIYERIMMNGRPAFFDINEDLCETFNRLYEERSKVYEKLTNTVFHNNTTLEKIVSEIILSLGEGS
jgi:shikimate kinase